MKVIAVHGGVSFTDERSMTSSCKEVVEKTDDVVEAVAELESCDLFNAGYGSNLTRSGTVECEAVVMRARADDGKVRFGAVGAVTRLCHPIRVAAALADSEGERKRRLIDPLTLVGAGAELWAEQHGFELCSNASLITERAKTNWTKAMKKIQECAPSDDPLEPVAAMDTVGAVGVDLDTLDTSSASSSGGIFLKRPGRLGQCTTYGAGVWSTVDTRVDESSGVLTTRSISISLSGCGEAVIRADAARTIGRALCERHADTPLPSVINEFMSTNFSLSSPLAADYALGHLIVGGVIVHAEREYRLVDGGKNEIMDESCDLIIFHNSPYMPVAWRDSRGSSKKMMSCRTGDETVTVVAVPL